MQENFVKVDLHIHTPASSCYKGKKNDDEYLRILRKARIKGLRIISITDHNSIEGYKTILKIRDRMTSEKRSLSAITDSEQAKSRLKLIERNLELFNSIRILPGIEFEVNNGVHMLIIFNDNIPTEQINRFLADGGYGPDNFGVEETPVLSNWDIFKLFEESTKYDCIVIDAHTDSSKGILNTIPPGTTRANCFRSSRLSAVCYKNEEQKEKLKNTLTISKEYYRSTPLSFLKFSDAHIADDVGQPLTWIKVEKISFESLKVAFSNPSEMVSTEEPSMSRILDDLLKSPNSFGIPDLSAESLVNIKKYICALSNTDGGYILLGVTPNKGKIGLIVKDVNNKEPYRSIIVPVVQCIMNVEPSPRPSVSLYPLQNNKAILSIHISKSPTLVNIKDDGLVYSVKANSISTLSATEIQNLVEEKVVKDIEFKINRRLESVQNDCRLIKNIFFSLPIIRFFDNNSFEARLQVSLSNSINLDPDHIEKLRKMPPNGTSRGNVFFVTEAQSPRLPYTYRRYSLPLFTLRNIDQSSILKETIYIVPGGAVYYSKRDYPFFSERLGKILKIYGASVRTKLRTKFVVSFLKSSFNLWYLKNKYDDTDIYKPDIFTNLRLPRLNTKRPDVIQNLSNVEDNFKKILKIETQFLGNISSVKKNDMEGYIEEHNLKIDQIAYHTDKLIYELLGLSDDDIITIEENLRLNDIYLPKALPK